MPLNRYQIRNEYSLADPQLYKVADKDDPEALLEGVAMAGLVGVLRQLGDLAEFAAEVFHDLHEEVMATAARGHSLIVWVRQLEAEFPSIERTLLMQTSHTSFLYNSGIDWHPNLCMNQNLVTRADLPRFVMDSYEEARGPPRLFLLDKFDVSGAGACLKRYTDPSFFKTESMSSNGRKSEAQREKKTRRVKKRAPRWRNGGTPESFPSSHAKLHQLFLEERLESDGNDPERRVKLKRRQFTGSFLDQDNKKSYMEKFVDMSPPELKITTSTDVCESGLEIVEIGTVSPLKGSVKTDKSLCYSPDTREEEMKPSIVDFSKSKYNEVLDSGATKMPGLHHGTDACKILTLVKGEECTDVESNSQVSVDDGFASEIDNYVDALANIESEVETDSECKRNSCYLNVKPVVADFYGSEGHGKPQSLFSDSQSVGNSTTSEDGNNFFKDTENSSSSISVNSMAESTKDLDAAVVVVPCVSTLRSGPDDISFDHHFICEEILRNEPEEHAVASNKVVQADDFTRSSQDSGEASKNSCLTGSNTTILPAHMEASLGENSTPSPELDEEYSNFAYPGIVPKQSAPKSTDNKHWPGDEHPLDDEASQNSGASAETSHDHSNALADSVSSSVQLNELGMSDLDACSDIRQPFAHPPSSDDKCRETMNPIDVNVDFFNSSTGESSEDQYSALECTQSLNIQEQVSETNNRDHGPLLDSALGAPPSSQGDQSVKEILTDFEAEEEASSASIVGLAKALPPISDALQAHGLESSFSQIAEAAETANFGRLEAARLGTVSLGYEPNSHVVSGSFEEEEQETVNSSIRIGKPSLIPDLRGARNQWQNLASEVAEAAPLEHHRAEAGKQCPGNYSNPLSVSENGQDATLNGIPDRASVSQDTTPVHQDQSKPVGTDAYLDDSGTQAIRIDAASEHECYDKHADKRKDFSDDAIPSGVPCELAITCNFVSAAEDDPTLVHEVGKGDHIEIVANNCGQVDAKNDLQENAMPRSSSEFLYAEKFKDQLISLTAECHQNVEQLVPGHDADLATQKDEDATNETLLESTSMMSSNESPPLILLDSSLPQVVQNETKLIDGVEAPSVSGNGRQDVESTSSYQIHLVKGKEFHVDGLSHDNLQPMSPLQDGDSEAKPLHPDEVSLQSINYAKQIQTPKCSDRNGYSSTAPLHSHAQLSVLSGTGEAIEKVKNPGELVCPRFPVLDMIPAEPPISLDPPPLPPLPPMQWRLGRLQNSSTAAEKQMVLRTPGPVQPMAPPPTNLESDIGRQEYADGNATQQGIIIPVAVSEVSSQNEITEIGEDSHSFASAQTSTNSQNGKQTSEESCQPSMNRPESESIVGAHDSEICLAVEEKVNAEIVSENGQPEHIPQVTEQEAVNSNDELSQSSTVLNDRCPQPGFVAPETASILPSTHDGVFINGDGNANGTLHSKPSRPRNLLIDQVVAIDKSKLRKVERVKPPVESKGDDGESPLEQLQLRKVGERTKLQVESKTEEIGPLLEQLQLRKVGERVKPDADQKPEETESPRVQLRKVVGRAHSMVGPKTEEIGPLLEQLQLRKVGERVKPDADQKPEETESPRVQLRKVVGRAQSMVGPKTEDRDSLLEQIRNKSFNLRPAVAARPNIQLQGPRTNLRVAAILQKASNIRQAMAGSDEEDDADSWSDC